LSDVALAALFGPLLTSGIALASFGVCSRTDLLLGLAFGTLTLWTFQTRQFEHLFRSKPEGFHTFIAYRNFDRARRIVWLESVLLLLLQPTLALAAHMPMKMIILLPAISVPMILFTSRVWRAASPLSSNLVRSQRWALIAHFAWTSWWIVALVVQWL